MERLEPELFRLDGSTSVDEFVRVEPLQRLEPTPEVVGADEVGEMLIELLMCVVVIALDGCFLDRAVHSLDLTIGPRMLGFGQPVLDTELRAGVFEAVCPDRFAFGQGFNDQGYSRSSGARCGEVGTVVGQDDVDLVWNRCDEMAQEITGGAPFCLTMKFDVGELAGAIDRHEQVELAFGGLHLGDIDMEEANRIALEPGLGCLRAVDLGETADPMALQTTMQG